MTRFHTWVGGLCLFLVACAQGPVAQGPRQSKRFDALNPGGPVYAPTELVVLSAPPSDLPFGSAFGSDQPPAPPEMSDPYWIPSYWGWKEPDWHWVPGRWVSRPKPGLIWILPRYLAVGSHHYWVTGYWN
jgi:hypothetical protein